MARRALLPPLVFKRGRTTQPAAHQLAVLVHRAAQLPPPRSARLVHAPGAVLKGGERGALHVVRHLRQRLHPAQHAAYGLLQPGAVVSAQSSGMRLAGGGIEEIAGAGDAKIAIGAGVTNDVSTACTS